MAALMVIGCGPNQDEDFMAAFSHGTTPIFDSPVAYFSAEFLLAPGMAPGWSTTWVDQFFVKGSLVKLAHPQRVWVLTGEMEQEMGRYHGYFEAKWPD